MTSLKNSLIQDVLKSLSANTNALPVKLMQGIEVPFTIRPLQLLTDLPLIYQWVNQAYAIPFWQMNGSYQSLFDAYHGIRLSSFSESMICSLGNQMVCQVDIYDPAQDSIRNYYTHQTGDIGFHLLMAPGKKPFPNCTAKVVRLFLGLFFYNTVIERVIGEPDAQNEKANCLLQQLGFQFIDQLDLPHKKANFYMLSRDRYNHYTASCLL